MSKFERKIFEKYRSLFCLRAWDTPSARELELMKWLAGYEPEIPCDIVPG